MPPSADEFRNGSTGSNAIEKVFRANPDNAYSLNKIEEAIIGTEMNRKKHLDLDIADLTLLIPLLFKEEKIESLVIAGISYFKWRV